MSIVARVVGLCLSGFLLSACAGGPGESPPIAPDPPSDGDGTALRAPKAGANDNGTAPMEPAVPASGASAPALVASPSAGSQAPVMSVSAPVEVLDRFAHPSGTFTAAAAAGLRDAMVRLGTFEADTDGFAFATPPTCPAQQMRAPSGTCACPGGGSYSYATLKNQQGDEIDGSASFQFAQCVGSAATYGGTMSIYVDGMAGGPMTGDQIGTFDLTSTTAGTSTKIEAAVKVGTTKDIALLLDGGWVVVRLGADGSTVYVLDHVGRWTCDGSSPHGTCTLDGSSPPETVTL